MHYVCLGNRNPDEYCQAARSRDSSLFICVIVWPKLYIAIVYLLQLKDIFPQYIASWSTVIHWPDGHSSHQRLLLVKYENFELLQTGLEDQRLNRIETRFTVRKNYNILFLVRIPLAFVWESTLVDALSCRHDISSTGESIFSIFAGIFYLHILKSWLGFGMLDIFSRCVWVGRAGNPLCVKTSLIL